MAFASSYFNVGCWDAVLGVLGPGFGDTWDTRPDLSPVLAVASAPSAVREKKKAQDFLDIPSQSVLTNVFCSRENLPKVGIL